MQIDIEKMTESELIHLNRRIIKRLKVLQEKRTQDKMYQFKIGERVSFQPDGYPKKVGILTRHNKKTVTIITESGEHWNVHPALIRSETSAHDENMSDPKIIPFQKKIM